MSLANFSLPYLPVTASPFLYANNEGRSIVNNLRLNAVLPPPPPSTFGEETQYRNDPYIRYQQQQPQQQQQQRYRQAPQPRGQEILTDVSSSFSSANSYASQDSKFIGYAQDFRKTQLRQEQQQQRPANPLSSLQQQQIQQQQIIQHQIQQQLPEQQHIQQQQTQKQQIPEQQHIQQQHNVPLQDRNQIQPLTDSRSKAQESYPERPNG